MLEQQRGAERDGKTQAKLSAKNGGDADRRPDDQVQVSPVLQVPHIEKRSNDRHRSERHIRHERVGKREINRVAGQRQRATERQKSRAFQSPNQTVHRKHADQRKRQRRESERIERKAPRNTEHRPPQHLRDQCHAEFGNEVSDLAGHDLKINRWRHVDDMPPAALHRSWLV